jgi:hypothetical protein
MVVVGPVRYKLSCDASGFTVKCPQGTSKFSGDATSRKPKLYVVSVDQRPIYVGVTRQRMRARLRLGWRPKGKHGYYGYAFRHHIKEADLDIWCQEDAANNSVLDVETVEAEVVFLIRSGGQWPLHQTEIHFHPSTTRHRRIANQVARYYKLGARR